MASTFSAGTSTPDLLDLVAEAVATVDRDLRLSSLNRRARRLLGHSAEKLLGRPLDEVLPRTWAQTLPETCRRSLREQRGTVFEGHLGSDTAKHWYRIRIHPHATGLTLLATVFSNRREGPLALWESRERYRFFSEATHEGILLSHDGVCIDGNTAALNMMGYTREECLGRSIFTFLAEEAHSQVRRMMAEPKAGPYETKGLHKDGHTLDVEITSQFATFRGKPTRVACLRDITRRKEAERALTRSLDRLARAERLAGVGNWEWDLVTNQVVWSSQLYRIYEFDPDNGPITFERILGRVHPLDRGWLLQHQKAFLGGTLDGDIEFRLLFPDERVKWLHTRIRVIHDDNGPPRQIIGVDLDITEAKAMEHRLQSARREAEGASQAKTEFLANMSHEIRTPLNGVMSMLQLLRYTDPSLEQEECIATALEAGRHLLRILNDILDLAKIESGVVDIVQEPFDLISIVKPVLGAFQEQAAQKGLLLLSHIDPRLPERLVGDEGRLRQVLFNLVANAVKYTDEGEVAVQVYPLPQTSPGQLRLHICVRDTGIGIPAGFQDRIFQNFAQVDCSHTRRHPGVGLGLAIVKRLVTHLGGSLALESEPGQGTEVHVVVSLGLPPGDFEPLLQEPEAPTYNTDYTGLRMLIADDDPINLLSLERLLTKLGFQVDTARNGQEFLDRFERSAYDVAIVDIQMPKLDGIEVIRRIRAGENTAARLPLVALTAHALPSDRDACLAAGADVYLAKPVEIEELSQTLAALLHRGA